MSHDYLWPLNRSADPDDMNTSFGPRINTNMWDFHDGIDLPASEGDVVHAVRAGTVHHAGPGGTGGYSSRHIVVEVDDPADGPIYNVYLHLQSIKSAVVSGSLVEQGQPIGTVGADNATYPHLHFEFREGTFKEESSVHPLKYLPYPDTANFSAPADPRFNWLDGYLAARLIFGAGSKLQGDLQRVEVDLRAGTGVVTRRIVDFDDKTTVNDSRGDTLLFVDDIGVEGYQKSDMLKHKRTDLAYGIVVRKIPRRCDTLSASVVDVAGHRATSKSIAIPNRTPTNDSDKAIDEFIDFENGQLPSTPWASKTSGSGTEISVVADVGHSGDWALQCVDTSVEPNRQAAAITYPLPKDRFEWRAQAWIKPTVLGIAPGDSVYLLSFLKGNGLGVAARIRNFDGTLRAGLVAKHPDDHWEDEPYEVDNGPTIDEGEWRRWRLELLRLATRETTAILYLSDGRQMREHARLDWDSSTREPDTFRAGVALTSPGATATVLLDELWLTESGMSH